MFEGKKAIAAVGRVAAIFLGGIIFAAVLPCGGFAACVGESRRFTRAREPLASASSARHIPEHGRFPAQATAP